MGWRAAQPRRVIAVLAAAVALAALSGFVPARGATVPGTCEAASPATPALPASCTYTASIDAGIAGNGEWTVRINRSTGPITITSTDAVRNPSCIAESGAGPLVTCAVGTVKAGETVTATAAGPGSAVAVGNPAPGVLNSAPQPGPYGVSATPDVPVTMSDGTVLRADVYTPTGGAGPFPVLLTQTPYGKATCCYDPYFVQRGYIEVVADVRGTGDSQGSWDVFDPIEGSDGATLVKWAAGLPHSDGGVGLFGGSYMGITQLLTAAAVGPNSPLKTILPVVSGTDIYRDAAFMGGLVDNELDAEILGGTAAYNVANPVAEPVAAGDARPSDVAAIESQHATGLTSFHAALAADIETGGDKAYDSSYWAARRPHDLLASIVANNIPAFLVGGWYDVFQRGETANYAALQNAWAGRPVDAPMAPDQPVTGRYQLLMGPWYHNTAGSGIDFEGLQLRWFDTWLKGIDNGLADTTTPLHTYELGTGNFVEARTWPPAEATTSRWYLGPGGILSSSAGPSAGSDQLVWTGASTPCSRSTSQWVVATPPPSPCADNDRANQVGPGVVTYTTAPFSEPTLLAGPIAASLNATATTTETEWVVQVQDVAPDGTSVPVTEGALKGSFRALDAGRTWTTGDGSPLRPYHLSTRETATPVAPGVLTRYDVEVFGTFATFAPGHRLRITISTGDTPHLGPIATDVPALAGGVYSLEHSSYVVLPLAPATAYPTACSICH